jgi:hypothetical protein
MGRWGLSCQKDLIELHPGLFEETLFPSKPIAFAHIDCDWYESVNVCITRILPHLAQGGIMVFDDYHSYSGCKKAVDQLLSSHRELQIIFDARSIGIRLP